MKLFVATLALIALASCSTWEKLDRTEKGAIIGTGTGAAIGGAAGDTTGALVGGAAGGIAGGVIGHELDDRDDRRYRQRR